MSSHHIIKEDQEPALLIIDPQTVPFEQVQELLEWSPTIIVSENALSEVITWGIKIDVVIAHSTNIPALANILQNQSPVKLLSYDTPKEALSTALYFLISTKQKAVNIITTETLETFEPFSSLDLSVFHTDGRWSYIRNGLYEKWLPAETILRFYPHHGQPDIKTQKDGIVTLSLEKGFWISEA
jgi:hypothetical protein